MWKIPETIALENAAGVSLVALTAAQGIWYRLGLQSPFSYDEVNVLAEHPEREWRKDARNYTEPYASYVVLQDSVH